MSNNATTPAAVEITALTTARGEAIRKTVSHTPAGVFSVSDYPRVRIWTRAVHAIPAELDALADFIRRTAADPTQCLITGAPTNLDRWPLDQAAPRWKLDRSTDQPATLAETASAWLPVDVDGIDTGTPLDPLDPAEAIAATVALLGAPFDRTGYVWQLTAKATPLSSTLRARLYFLLDRAIANDQRKSWAASVNRRTGLNLADAAIYSAAQPLYTASPAFDGAGIDPFPQRIGVTYGELDLLPWGEVEQPDPSRPVEYTGWRSKGPVPPGIPARLARIGDGKGQEGIDGPIYESILAMVRAGWTRERIHAAIIEAVSQTTIDPAKHGSEYVRRKTSPRELNRQIANAEKFIKRTEQLVRATQTRKTAPSEVMTLAEAEQAMQAEAERFYAQTEPGNTVIFATVGLGKTRAVADALPADKRILWAHQTHEQGGEILDRLNRTKGQTTANKIEGRRGSETRPGLCRRPAVMQAIHEAGLDRHAESIACGLPGGPRCEFAHDCEYFKQFGREEAVRLIPHAYLTEPMQQSKAHRADFVASAHGLVCDESPLADLIGRANVKIETIANQAPVLSAALAKIEAGESLTEGELAELENERVLQFERITLTATPAPADEWQLLHELKGIAERRGPSLAAIYRAVTAHQAGDVNGLWFGTDGAGERRVFAAWKSAPPTYGRGLFLDATGCEEVYRALLGEDTRFARIEAEQRLEIIQASDRPFGKRSLGLDDPGEDGLLARATALARMLGAGFIGNKSAVEAAQQRGYLTDDTPVGWFNALRGLNRMEHLDTLVVCGRPEPGALEVEAIARALWPREALNFTGRYVWRQDGLLSVASHEDPRIDAVLRMLREAEIHQAIGRLRAVRAARIKRVILLTSTPIDLPTQLLNIDDILPPEKMARLFHAGQGVIPQSPDLMARLCPELWPKAKAAEDWGRKSKPDFPLYRTLFKQKSGLLRRIRYLQKGTAKPRHALTALDDFDTWLKLEGILGAPIAWLREIDAETPAPAPPAPAPVWEKPAYTVKPYKFREPIPPPPWPAWAKPAFKIHAIPALETFTRFWEDWIQPAAPPELLTATT